MGRVWFIKWGLGWRGEKGGGGLRHKFPGVLWGEGGERRSSFEGEKCY